MEVKKNYHLAGTTAIVTGMFQCILKLIKKRKCKIRYSHNRKVSNTHTHTKWKYQLLRNL